MSTTPSGTSPTTARFVVGIAASRGGVKALSALLAALPASFGAAVVVVQHLAPNFPSHLPEVLQLHTALVVAAAGDGDILRTGWVAVAPPNRHVCVSDDSHLALSDAPAETGVRPSADVLFRSLADVFGGRAIAVVLTGSGRDGAAGIRAVKERGGVTIAQDQGSSECWDMPGAAVGTGCVDHLLPLSEIAGALERFVA